MGEWQPIETAPKDGSRFMFASDDFIGVAFYINGKAFAADSLGPTHRTSQPTHWMPLPDLPLRTG